MWYWINNYRRGAGAYELFGWPCCFFNAGDNLVWSKRDISVISLISSSFTSWEKKEELSVFLKQLCVWVFFLIQTDGGNPTAVITFWLHCCTILRECDISVFPLTSSLQFKALTNKWKQRWKCTNSHLLYNISTFRKSNNASFANRAQHVIQSC